MTLPYPPPWQDAPTLCKHICISESTLDNWIRDGILPPAQKIGGKRMWKWSEVDARLAGKVGIVPDADDLTRRVFDATKAAASR